MAQSKTPRRSKRFQTFGALRNRNFRWFWINGATQAMAQGMQFLILGWLVLDITDSASQLGLVIFAFGLANIPFSLLGGIIADRANRLKLLILTRICVSALIFLLAFLRIADLLDIWHVYAVVFLLGTIQGLNQPARQAIVADLVERDDMMNAIALHTMVNQTGQIIGPAAAGGIIELVGIGPALLVNAGLYVSGIIFLLLITGLPRQTAARGASLLADLGAGLHCVRSTPILLTLIVMTVTLAFFALSFRQIMPAFADEVLEIGPGGSRVAVAGGRSGIIARKSDFSHAGKMSGTRRG